MANYSNVLMLLINVKYLHFMMSSMDIFVNLLCACSASCIVNTNNLFFVAISLEINCTMEQREIEKALLTENQ